MLRTDFDRYYTNDELTEILAAYAAEYPDLCTLASIGKSYEGREIWAVTLTNSKTGSHETKPAMYIDANIHAGEITGSAVCLYTIHRLLTEFGQTELITHLMDTRTFYILPRIAVDGAAVYMTSEHTPRSTVHAYRYRADAPGLHETDMDGDGKLVYMRVKDPNGPWKASPVDARLLVVREPGDLKGPFYRIYPEGFINDYKGAEIQPASSRFNDMDLNRNFPGEWEAQSKNGNGLYPLSEPETKAVMQFIAERPNIGAVQALHTWSGCVLRPYSARPDTDMPGADRRMFDQLGQVGERITGYPMISIFHDLTPRFTPPRRGVLLDFLYQEWGMVALSTELWDMPGRAGVKDRHMGNWLLERSAEDEAKVLAWVLEHVPQAWVDWHPFDHPQLGLVEIGGLDYKVAYQNPPAGQGFLLDECVRNAEFTFAHAAALPRLAIRELTAEPVGEDIYKVRAVVQNEGWLPTHVTAQGLKKGEPPIKAEILVENGELVGSFAQVEIGHLDGYNAEISSFTGFRSGFPQQDRIVEWFVRAGGEGARVTVKAHARRAGTATAAADLK